MATAVSDSFLALLLLVLIHCTFGIVRYSQNAGVEGQLLCFGQPAENVLVKLYQQSSVLDVLMDVGKSDSNGSFKLGGTAVRSTRITPKLNIYHDCNDGWNPCQRKRSYVVPPKYISMGLQPVRFYDLGQVELSHRAEGETRDCFH
uniref:Transthyretin-like protein 5 n=1 Tax=Ascaris suum TaxID=6253 RepID=F1LF27_ASCSU